MDKKISAWKKCGLVALTLLVGTAAAACAKDKDGSSEEPITSSVQQELYFHEGYLDTITLGDSFILDEYVVFSNSENDDYSLVVTLGEQTIDLTGRPVWTPQEPGEYTMTYTINSGEYAGSCSIKLIVVAQKMEWSYSTETRFVYEEGTTMHFADFFEKLNIEVRSYYDYEIKMS